MKETNQLAVGEMSEFSTEAIDLSSIVENSQKLVRNKKFPEVLLFLANVASEIQADKVRKDAETNIKQYPLHTLFTSTHMTQEGRVAARSPGLDPNNLNSEESQKAIWAEMIQHY